MYASALGDNAVERYAMFLTSLELTADINERRLALTRAREHGLDVHRVAVVTAERTIERAFEVGGTWILRKSYFELYLPASTPVEGTTPLCHCIARQSLRPRASAASFDRVDNIRGWNLRYRARTGNCHFAVLPR
jgi:hypothetical protein